MRASDKAYAALKDEIVGWGLQPGAVLSEVEQSQRLGVSRTPLREALRRLAGEGLVVAGRGRTLVVAGMAAQDLRHLFELREALEVQAARLAATRRRDGVFEELAERFAHAPELVRADDRTAYYGLVRDLDEALDGACGSPYLVRSLQQMRLHAARARRLAQDDVARLVQAAAEHRTIAQAVAEQDGTLAAHATAVHLDASLRWILRTVPTPPEHAEGARP